MKGDFSRFIFNPNKHYTGVLMQQGRVQLDADWNEQVVLSAYLRQIQANDVIGACGMPADSPGFEIIVRQGLRFDGQDNFVFAGKDTDLSLAQTKSFTLETWLNPQPGGHGGVIAGRFALFENLNLPEYVLYINPDKTISFLWIENLEEEFYQSVEILQSEIAAIYKELEIEKIALRFREIRTVDTVPFGKFSYIAVTLNANEVNIYLNGHLAGKARTGNFQSPGEGMFFIGTGWYNKRLYHVFDGVIDNMALWKTGLSPDSTRENMYARLTGKEPDLLRLWRFNREAAQNGNVNDWSVNNKPCALGAGREENFPEWEPPFLWIGRGRCYLHGIFCENEHDILFTQQPNTPGIIIPQFLHRDDTFLFYLEVWHRHITAIQDPGIRETALGGPDTTTRLQAVWQIKYIPKSESEIYFSTMESKGQLMVRRQQAKAIRENRLYRVEIHTGGGMAGAPLSQAFYPILEVEKVSPEQKQVMVKEWKGDMQSWDIGQYVELFGVGENREIFRALAIVSGIEHSKKQLTLNKLQQEAIGVRGLRLRQIATFKWSKENGTLVFPIAHEESSTLVLDDPDGNGIRLKPGQWLEVSDDHYVLRGKAAPLVKIKKLEQTPEGKIIVILEQPPQYKIALNGQAHPLVRVWDQNGDAVDPTGGVIPIQGHRWIDLDEGIQVYFTGGGVYHNGDYWWVPVRSETQEIQWPHENHQPLSCPPHGIHHHYAPLAVVDIHPGRMEVKEDLRHIFEPLIKQDKKLVNAKQ
jgi:hypothetical protein